jgi:hypothetical protein
VVNATIVYLIGHAILGEVEFLTPPSRSGFRSSFFVFAVGLVPVAVGQLLLVTATLWTYSSGERSQFWDVLVVSAWAYVPFTVESLVRYLRARRKIQHADLSDAGTAQIETQFNDLVFSDGPVLAVVTLLAVVWMTYILTEGTAGVLDLDREQTWRPAVALGIVLLLIKLSLGNTLGIP